MAVTFSPEYAVASGQPMTHARILYAATPGTVSATSAADGFPAASAAAVDTASWWMPSAAPATWTLTPAAPATIDAVGIAAHTLAGVPVLVEAMVGGVWQAVASITPADAGAILVLFAPVVATAIRVTLGAVARIGVIYAGQALAMPRMGYAGVGMIDLGRQATLTSYVSEGGQLLARFIQRAGLKGSYEWENVPEDWWRANGDAFALAARTAPFFIAARPDGYPTDCAYAWVDAPIVPTRQGTRNWLTVGFEAMGHADA